MANFLKTDEVDLLEGLDFDSTAGTFQVDDYVPASIKRKWPDLFDSPECIDPPGDSQDTYEASLAKFVRTPSVSFPILLILGGIGCGKTSSLVYTFKRTSLCNHDPRLCEVGPTSVYVDLASVAEDPKSETEEEEQLARVWDCISTGAVTQIARLLTDPDTHIVSFWRWCKDPVRLSGIEPMQFKTYLVAYSDDIDSGDARVLKSAYTALWLTLSTRDQCLYKLTELAFLTSPKPHRHCTLLWIDNIDHLAPAAQNAIVEFAHRAPKVLPCRILLPIRPYTLARRRFAARLSAYVTHSSPDILTVLSTRIDRFAQQPTGQAAAASALRSLLRRLQEEGGRPELRFTGTLRQTCGDSVRFMLRNVHNMAVSPSLSIARTDPDPFARDEIGNAALYEAYYCNAARRLRRDQYDNVFDVSNRGDDERRVIKIHLLRLLSRENSAKSMALGELVKYSKLFGFHNGLLKTALNELLDKNRPLVWSRMRHEYRLGDLDQPSDNDSLHLTTIGDGYATHLYSNVYYIKECAYDSHQDWGAGEKDSLRNWRAHAAEFIDEVKDADDVLQSRVQRRFGAAGVSVLWGVPSWVGDWAADVKAMMDRML